MRNTFQKKQVIKYPKRTSPLSNQYEKVNMDQHDCCRPNSSVKEMGSQSTTCKH